MSKNLFDWFFGVARGLNSRGKYINLADNGEPDEVTFRTLLGTTLLKKFDASNFQDQASHTDITAFSDNDKFTVPANLPKVALVTGSKMTLNETAPTALDPKRHYELDAPMATDAEVYVSATGNKYVAPKNLPHVTTLPVAGNAATVTMSQVAGRNTYQIYAPAATPSATNIIDSNYAAMAASKSANTLLPGMYYKFLFTTKHVIDDTSAIHTGDTEVMLLLATSNSEFSKQALSLTFPTDVVFYDFDNNLCEDGLTPRVGKVTRRINTLRDIDVPFDFRESRTRVYGMIEPPAWVASVTYIAGSLVKDGTSIYACAVAHTSAVFAVDYGTNQYWAKVVDLSVLSQFLTSINARNVGFFTLTPDTSNYIDVLAVSPTSSGIHIGTLPLGFPATGAIALVFNGSINCQDIEIKNDCYSIFINGAKDVTIEPMSHLITIDSQNFGNIKIIGNTNSIFIGQECFGTYIGPSSSIFIAAGSTDNYISRAGTIFIGENCIGNKITDCTGTRAANGSSYNEVFNGAVELRGGCIGNKSHYCGGAIFEKDCVSNVLRLSGGVQLGRTCDSNTITESGGIILGTGCDNNVIQNCGSAVELPDNSSGNQIYSCSNITINSSCIDSILELNDSLIVDTIDSCRIFGSTGISSTTNLLQCVIENSSALTLPDCTLITIKGSTNITLPSGATDSTIESSSNITITGAFEENVIKNSIGINASVMVESEFNIVSGFASANVINDVRAFNCSSLTLDDIESSEFSGCNLIIINVSCADSRFVNCNQLDFSGASNATDLNIEGLASKTINGDWERVSSLIHNGTLLVYAASLDGVVIDKASPDGELWYTTISNAGVITQVKVV